MNYSIDSQQSLIDTHESDGDDNFPSRVNELLSERKLFLYMILFWCVFLILLIFMYILLGFNDAYYAAPSHWSFYFYAFLIVTRVIKTCLKIVARTADKNRI